MNTSNKIIVFLGDIVVLMLSLAATVAVSFPTDFQNQFNLHLKPFLIIYVIWLIVFFIFNFYENKNIKISFSNLQLLAISIIVSGGVSITLFYLFPVFAIAPKTNLAINIGFFILFFVLWRRFIGKIVAKRFFETIVFIGKTPESINVHNKLSSPNDFGYRSVGVVDSVEEVRQLSQKNKIDKIVLAKNIGTLDLYKITRLGTNTTPLLKIYEQVYEKIPLTLIDDGEAVTILNKENNPIYNLVSRCVGVVTSLTILIATLPITLLSALAIYLEDRGSIFYTQTRSGKKNSPFKVLKFRTMTEDAEKDGAKWAAQSDPRITKVGALLRKTHIDEIPQMINILRGDINLVGPRPERPEFVTELENTIPYYFIRHDIKPGFTGWAQIKFRYARSAQDSATKLEYDLYYLKNRNLVLDLGIILKTAQIIFTH